MKRFIDELKTRSRQLYFFGLACLLFALGLGILSFFSNVEVAGVNAWYKPMKFSLSIGIYSWTMGWFIYYLENFRGRRMFIWSVIILLAFEIIYISTQAGRGEKSHFNGSTPFYEAMYALMGIAATIVTLWTLYIGILFMIRRFPRLPGYYVWAIRMGILLFVVFALVGGLAIGSNESPIVGGEYGSDGIPFLNWSVQYGDLRIAHFTGMHALQVLPLLSYYIIKSTKATIIFGFLYLLLATFTLIMALGGIPLIKF